MALAGFSADDISLQTEKGVLTIEAQKADDGGNYIHQGIAARAFSKMFRLAEYMKVNDAQFVDRILTIFLQREIPEADKPKQISISTKQKKLIKAADTPMLRHRVYHPCRNRMTGWPERPPHFLSASGIQHTDNGPRLHLRLKLPLHYRPLRSRLCQRGSRGTECGHRRRRPLSVAAWIRGQCKNEQSFSPSRRDLLAAIIIGCMVAFIGFGFATSFGVFLSHVG